MKYTIHSIKPLKSPNKALKIENRLFQDFKEGNKKHMRKLKVLCCDFNYDENIEVITDYNENIPLLTQLENMLGSYIKGENLMNEIYVNRIISYNIVEV